MTVTPPGMPRGQYTAHAPHFQSTPPTGPTSPVAHPASTAAKGSKLATAAAMTALLVATVALVVAIVAVNRANSPQANSASPPTTSAPTTDTADADRTLCTTAGPLLRERADIGKAFVNTGESGSPERDSAIPKFRERVESWASRIQPILDTNRSADSFLGRTLQRMVDDTLLYAESIRPGTATDYDKLAWNDSVVAYGGPFFKCHQLGVTW